MEVEWDRLRRDALVGAIDATVAKAKEVSTDVMGPFEELREAGK